MKENAFLRGFLVFCMFLERFEGFVSVTMLLLPQSGIQSASDDSSHSGSKVDDVTKVHRLVVVPTRGLLLAIVPGLSRKLRHRKSGSC